MILYHILYTKFCKKARVKESTTNQLDEAQPDSPPRVLEAPRHVWQQTQKNHALHVDHNQDSEFSETHSR